MDSLKLKITTDLNRPHITYDILSVLKNMDIEIKNLEMHPYIIYLKIPSMSEEKINLLLKEIYKIKEVKLIEKIKYFKVEEQMLEIKDLLEFLPQGIMMINVDGTIKYTNKYLKEEILSEVEEDIVGKHINTYIRNKKLDSMFEKSSIIKSLIDERVKINNKELILSIMPIESEKNSNLKLGYVVSLAEDEYYDIFNSFIGFKEIIGNSNQVNELILEAKEYSLVNKNIFIIGEEGTCKEPLARAIHNHSHKRGMAFIGIDFSELSNIGVPKEVLYEDEETLINILNNCTIFLNNIEYMPTFVQEKLYEKLNSIYVNQNYDRDIKIISASKYEYFEIKEKYNFKEELAYILFEEKMIIPPVRNRKEDIPYIINEYLKKNVKNGKIMMEQNALEKLNEYDWPGNMEEIHEVLDRAIENSRNSIIREDDIVFKENKKDIEDYSLTEYMDNIERKTIVDALSNNDSIRSTARNLKITNTMLLNRIKKYNITDTEWKKKER